MEEITVEDPNDSDNNHVMVVPVTPVKPKQSLKFYVRRKSIKLLNKPQDFDGLAIPQPEIEEKCFSPRDCDIEIVKGSDESEIIQGDTQRGDGEEEEETDSKETLQEKQNESRIPQDNPQFVKEKGKKKKNTKLKTKKQRFHRPRIMEAGRKPRNPATTRMRTISKKRKKEKDSEEEVVHEPETPEKQNEKRRKNEKTKRNVVRTLTFDQETVLTCLELSRKSGPNFPNGRKRMATRRRSIWKKKSRRSSRKRNVDRWARIALSEWLKETMPLVASNHKDNSLSSQPDVSLQLQIEDTKMTYASYVTPKPELLHFKRKGKTKDHQKHNGISSPADVPLRIEDTPMRAASCVVLKRCSKKTKDIDKPLTREVLDIPSISPYKL